MGVCACLCARVCVRLSFLLLLRNQHIVSQALYNVYAETPQIMHPWKSVEICMLRHQKHKFRERTQMTPLIMPTIKNSQCVFAPPAAILHSSASFSHCFALFAPLCWLPLVARLSADGCLASAGGSANTNGGNGKSNPFGGAFAPGKRVPTDNGNVPRGGFPAGGWPVQRSRSASGGGLGLGPGGCL